MVTDIFLVTDTGFFEFLFLNSQYSRLCSKTQEKNAAGRYFRQPKFGDTDTRTAAYNIFS